MDWSTIKQNSSIEQADEDPEEQLCGEAYTLARFVFVLGSSLIAFFGVLANLFLLIVFTITSRHNTPPTLYPRVLAVLDMIICAVYVLLFGADAAIVYLGAVRLFSLYYIYVVPVFVLSRITQLSIPYILIFATLERLAWTIGKRKLKPIFRRMFEMNGLYTTVTVIMVMCIALRLPTAWAITIYHYPACPDFFRSKAASQAEWARESYLYYIYDFHFLSIAQTVIPFFVLLLLNIIIVKKMMSKGAGGGGYSAKTNGQLKSAIGGDANIPDDVETDKPSRFSLTPIEGIILNRSSIVSAVARKASTFTGLMSAPKVKSAVYTMVCIVASYLISNTLHLILTVLERSDSDLLKDPNDPALASTFHTTFSDIVSFVYMFTSAIRFMIYYVCNVSIRNDMKRYLFGKRIPLETG